MHQPNKNKLTNSQKTSFGLLVSKLHTTIYKLEVRNLEKISYSLVYIK